MQDYVQQWVDPSWWWLLYSFLSSLLPGLSYIARKVAIRLNQSHILTKNEDGTYTFQFLSTMANSSITFNPGEEFEEVKADGVKVYLSITILF